MDAYFYDVLNLLIRWLHMIAGIAWIGASFYFVMLDTSLRAPKKQEDTQRGVFGELWAVHGGGFYHSQKYLTGPKNEPLSDNLHWSKWEAYTTWLSGFSLFVLLYWLNAPLYLIDANVMPMGTGSAIAISLAFIIGAWVIYDQLCKSPIANNEKILAAILFVLCALAAWGMTQLFSGRGAFILFGVMLGTMMVANVFFVIIPGQQKMVAAIRAGQAVDPKPGIMGKQRSVHNTYFTLPVLLTMISNHYAFTYGHEYNWLVLIGISLAGILIRVFFVSRHTEGKTQTWALLVGVLILVASLLVVIPASPQKVSGASVPVAPEQLMQVVSTRCSVCHSSTPTQAGFASAPKGVVYDEYAQVLSQAASIHQQTVATKAMPIGNLTGMTDEERRLIARWHQQIAD